MMASAMQMNIAKTVIHSNAEKITGAELGLHEEPIFREAKECNRYLGV